LKQPISADCLDYFFTGSWMLKSIKHLVKSSNLSHTLFHVSGSFTYNIAHKMTVAAAVIFVRQHRTESNGQFPSVSSPFLAAAELSPPNQLLTIQFPNSGLKIHHCSSSWNLFLYRYLSYHSVSACKKEHTLLTSLCYPRL
jgi:hypothetical protein